MKILEVHYSTSWAGAERFVVDLCNELTADNDVYLCTIIDDNLPGKAYYKKELLPSVHYINLGCKNGNDIRGIYRLFKKIKKLKPDIVHAHTDALNLWIPSLFYTKCKYFHTIHSLAQKRQYKPWLTPVYKYFYKSRIQAIAISKVCRQSYIDLYNLNNSLLIDNGRSVMRPTSELESVKKEIGIYRKNNDTKVFVHVARCSDAKNEPLLFSTFNRLFADKVNVILLIIGANYDAPQYRYLLDNASPNIHWLGVKNNVCDYLMNADFFVLSSKWEGMPISLLEAISVGIIPVCTPAGGIPDVLKDDSLGFLSPTMNEDDLYATVVRAIENYAKIDKHHLVDYFQKNYSMRHCADFYQSKFLSEYD